MTTASSEKVKLYLVVALASVALVVAYFRFFYPKDEPVVVTLEPPAQTTVYKIDPYKINKPIKSRAAGEIRQPILVANIRDIFEPPYIPPQPDPKTAAGTRDAVGSKAVAPEDIPLNLKGTIIGGNKPMAIINEKFVRLGEKIDIFRITWIDTNKVVLRAGTHERVLTVLKPEDHLGQ